MFNRYCNIECYVDEFMELRSDINVMKNEILNGTKNCDDGLAYLREEIIQNIFGEPAKILTLKMTSRSIIIAKNINKDK